MTIFERIRDIAKEKGLNLQETAEKADLGINTIYSWKKKEPSVEKLKSVARVLNVSVDYLLGNTDDMHSTKKDEEPLDLNQVADSERDNAISANGEPISDDDWAIIKAVLAKYPKRD